MATGTAIGALSGTISAGNEKLFAHQSIPVPVEIRAVGAALQSQGKIRSLIGNLSVLLRWPILYGWKQPMRFQHYGIKVYKRSL